MPLERWNAFKKGFPRTLAWMQAFAEALGIAPGTVVGRLQHEGVVEWDWGWRFKRRFEWKKLQPDPGVWTEKGSIPR
ncbi:MAG: hypothetical protein HQL94_09525 [Magnetococcales bacterium]|nr:hypothetical protein [Magnetococcales bacterium]